MDEDTMGLQRHHAVGHTALRQAQQGPVAGSALAQEGQLCVRVLVFRGDNTVHSSTTCARIAQIVQLLAHGGRHGRIVVSPRRSVGPRCRAGLRTTSGPKPSEILVLALVTTESTRVPAVCVYRHARVHIMSSMPTSLEVGIVFTKVGGSQVYGPTHLGMAARASLRCPPPRTAGHATPIALPALMAGRLPRLITGALGSKSRLTGRRVPPIV